MEIFVNYRREDSQAATGRIDDHLREAFGDDRVYRDVDSIPLGVDFVAHISEQVARCEVLLVIMGKNWLSPRLSSPQDFVRVELEAALRRTIPVIPVLVDGAALPSADQLPESLRPLVTRNAIEVDTGADFNLHIEKLIVELHRIVDEDRVVKSARGASLNPLQQSLSSPEAGERSSRSGWSLRRVSLARLGALGALVTGIVLIALRLGHPSNAADGPIIQPSRGGSPAAYEVPRTELKLVKLGWVPVDCPGTPGILVMIDSCQETRPLSWLAEHLRALKIAGSDGFKDLPESFTLVPMDAYGQKNNRLVVRARDGSEPFNVGVGYNVNSGSKDGCLSLTHSGKMASGSVCQASDGTWWLAKGASYKLVKTD